MKTLKLGLTMAGAVSAGAYTAGVMDYLLETLEKWEREKQLIREGKSDRKDIPMHDVEICVMGGASAGGMTTAITLAVLSLGHEPIDYTNYAVNQNNPEALKRFSKNKFFDSWVNLVAEEMMPKLLNESDIQHKLSSLLNSTFIDEVADKAFPDQGMNTNQLPNYFNPELELLLTLTYLEGYELRYPFKGSTANATYISKTHRDFAHFKLWNSEKDPYRGQIPLRANDPEVVIRLKEAAKATGAFPIGLKHREFNRKKKYILNNPLINPFVGLEGLDPEIPMDTLFLSPDLKPGEDENTECSMKFVDGGLLNNEPFEITQQILRNNFSDTNNLYDEDKFDNTIIMIDPFPSEPTDVGEFSDESLMDIVSKVFKVLRSEPLVKPGNILKAYTKESFDRFTISPSAARPNPDGTIDKVAGSSAIACGSLDGFGGFLSKTFREHDFFLGRKNCQSFLRNHFAVSEETTNEIFVEGYECPESRARFRFSPNPMDKHPRYFLPIIPDMDCEAGWRPKTGVPSFPEIKEEVVRQVKKDFKRRLKHIFKSMMGGRWWYIFILPFIALGKWWLTRKIIKVIRTNLTDHGMYRVRQKKD